MAFRRDLFIISARGNGALLRWFNFALICGISIDELFWVWVGTLDLFVDNEVRIMAVCNVVRFVKVIFILFHFFAA